MTTSHWRGGTGAAACAALVVILLSAHAPEIEAQETAGEFEDQISVIQRKPFLRKGRFELVPQFGVTVNDSLIQQFRVGGNAVYHITEPFWIGGTFGWYDLGELGGVTDQYNEVLEKTSSVPDLVEVKYYVGGDVGYSPLYGKFALFNRLIIYYDLAVFVGGGLLNHTTSQTNGATGAPAGSLGVQQRLFLADWLALTMELRDLAFVAELRDGNSFTNILSFSGGVSFFFPFTFEYSTAR